MPIITATRNLYCRFLPTPADISIWQSGTSCGTMNTHSAAMRPHVPNPMNDSQDNYGDAESAPREITSREYDARLLTAPAALMQLSLVEAKIVVSYMRPDRVPAGETL